MDVDPAVAQRRAAAQRAVEQVADGMVLGFGTGRAAVHALEALAQRVRQGLRVRGVPSSLATEQKARELGLALTTLEAHSRLDLTIDGADEVDPRLHLIKGGGGALLREKVLAAASRRVLIVVEASKLVPHLGATRGVPLEVLPFAYGFCVRRLAELGGQPQLRRLPDGSPSATINGNWVIDCGFPPTALADPARLDDQLHAIPGLLETGLFLFFKSTVFAGRDDGVQVLESR